jgi:hypothetical protein
VAAWQAVDLGERRIDRLCVEAPPALEERFLVTEVPYVRATARDHDRVRHQVQSPLDQIPPDRRQADERADAGSIHAPRSILSEVIEESRPGVLTRAKEYRVGMQRRFIRQRRHVQSAERHVDATAPVVVRDAIGTLRGCDVDLNHDQIRLIRQLECFDVLVLDLNLGVFVEVPGERRQAEGREE